MKPLRTVRLLLFKPIPASYVSAGKIDGEVVAKTHFGGFEDGEDDNDGEDEASRFP